MKKGGFTLVELLVVISIIALLLAVLIPALSKARKLAQRTICLNNIKSQSDIQMAYASSNNGKFPMHADSSPLWVQTWVLPYDISKGKNQYSQVYAMYSKGWIKDPKIFLCPMLTSLGDFYTKLDAGSGGIFTGWNGVHWKSTASYIMIPYNWFAYYRHSATISTSGQGGKVLFNYSSTIPGKWNRYKVNEPSWPDKMEDCTGSKAFIAHSVIYTDSYGDYSHGGRGYSLDDSVDFDKFMGSEENPIGYSDGHVSWTKKTGMRPRATANGFWEVLY